MKQLGAAFGYYVDDNQEWCPPAYQTSTWTEFWFHCFNSAGYVSKGVYGCPSSIEWDVDSAKMNYGICYSTFGLVPSLLIKVSDPHLKMPTRQAMFLETMPRKRRAMFGLTTTMWTSLAGNYGGPQYNRGSTNGDAYSVAYRHKSEKNTNAVMLDGHVSSINYTRTINGRGLGVCPIFAWSRPAGQWWWARCHANPADCSL